MAGNEIDSAVDFVPIVSLIFKTQNKHKFKTQNKLKTRNKFKTQNKLKQIQTNSKIKQNQKSNKTQIKPNLTQINSNQT